MKKAILCFVLAAALIMPCSAFGLEMLNDGALDEVTGQAGVSIAVDDVQMFLNVETFAWIDADGYDTNSNYGGTEASDIGAAFVVNDFQMDTININMIGLAGSAADAAEGASGIDTDPSLQAVASSLEIGVDGGTAYALDFDDGGNTFYRNPGNQTIGSVSDYDGGTLTGSTDDGTYGGSLSLASATAGSIPMFYDYGDTTAPNSPTLNSADTSQGLNNYTNTNNISSQANFHPQALTIDMTGELPLHTGGLAKAADPGSNATIGGVLIGLPTMEIHIQEMNIGSLGFTADISSNDTADINNVKNSGETFGSIYLDEVTFTTLGGWMEIAPTGDPDDSL